MLVAAIVSVADRQLMQPMELLFFLAKYLLYVAVVLALR